MQRQPISSSMISSVGYDEMEQTLEVEFSNGHIWQYMDVPEVAYSGMIESASIGKHFHQNIKNSFESVQVN